MKIFISFLLCLPLLAAAAPEPLPLGACQAQAPYGFPSAKKTSIITICRQGYLSLFDTRASIPAVVTYVLRPEHAVGCNGREGFEPDPVVKGIPNGKDYAKSGYDIGHLANAADLAWSEQTKDEAGLFTNATPQAPGFNRGIWKKLEDGTRGWALSRKNPLLIYVVPIYDRKKDEMIGDNLVTVPHSHAKVLVDTVTSEVMVFLFKSEGSRANLSTFITSIAEVQKQSGVRLPLPEKPVFTKVWSVELKSARKAKAGACALR
jgi:endonuclease G, mitochondrial